MASKLLSAFAKQECAHFLQTSIGTVLQELLDNQDDLDFEIDNSKVENDQVLVNIENVSTTLVLNR